MPTPPTRRRWTRPLRPASRRTTNAGWSSTSIGCGRRLRISASPQPGATSTASPSSSSKRSAVCFARSSLITDVEIDPETHTVAADGRGRARRCRRSDLRQGSVSCWRSRCCGASRARLVSRYRS